MKCQSKGRKICEAMIIFVISINRSGDMNHDFPFKVRTLSLKDDLNSNPL